MKSLFIAAAICLGATATMAQSTAGSTGNGAAQAPATGSMDATPMPAARPTPDTIDRDGGEDKKGELPGKGASSPASSGTQTR